jgi:hypothetical protein
MLDGLAFRLEATGRAAIATLVVAIVAPIIAIAAVVAAITVATVTARLTLFFATRRALIAVLAARIALVAGIALALTLGAVHLEIVVIAVDIGVRPAALLGLAGILLLEARPALREDAEIVISELEVIFGVDAVALHLRVARQILVFLKKLRRVAARAVVDAVAIALVGVATTLLALATTAAPAAVVRLTIVHQRLFVLSLTQSAIDHQ